MYNNITVQQLGYNLYDEYLERYYQNAINYSKQKGLPVRYYHIRVDQSKNYDPETGMQITAKDFKWDRYEFVPIIEMSPPTQQTMFDPTSQGTSYIENISMTIIGIKNPLPGDLFTFYDISGKSLIDITQVYRVKNVQYIKEMNKKIPVYRLDCEVAPFKNSTLAQEIKHNTIDHYFFFQDINDFITDDKFVYFKYIKDNKNKLREYFNDLYCNVDATFNACNFDSAIKILQRNWNFPNPFPIAKVYKNYDVSDLMAAFDLLYLEIGRDPITNTTLFVNDQEFKTPHGPVITKRDGNVPEFNKLEEVNNKDNKNNKDNNDNNEQEEYKVSYKDKTCFSYCLLDENKNKEFYVFKIHKKPKDDQDNTDNTDNTDDQELELSEFFDYYNNLYKFFYCYRILDPDFYNKSSIDKNTLKVLENNEINKPYYNINDLSQNIYEKKYDPGYYISYEGGAVNFNKDCSNNVQV